MICRGVQGVPAMCAKLRHADTAVCTVDSVFYLCAASFRVQAAAHAQHSTPACPSSLHAARVRTDVAAPFLHLLRKRKEPLCTPVLLEGSRMQCPE
jgi:hypothetical protein